MMRSKRKEGDDDDDDADDDDEGDTSRGIASRPMTTSFAGDAAAPSPESTLALASPSFSRSPSPSSISPPAPSTGAICPAVMGCAVRLAPRGVSNDTLRDPLPSRSHSSLSHSLNTLPAPAAAAAAAAAPASMSAAPALREPCHDGRRSPHDRLNRRSPPPRGERAPSPSIANAAAPDPLPLSISARSCDATEAGSRTCVARQAEDVIEHAEASKRRVSLWRAHPCAGKEDATCVAVRSPVASPLRRCWLFDSVRSRRRSCVVWPRSSWGWRSRVVGIRRSSGGSGSSDADNVEDPGVEEVGVGEKVGEERKHFDG
eukprot:2962803-Rhodomonas_salina.1